MTDRYAIMGARILAGRDWLDGHALMIEGDQIAAICLEAEVPEASPRHQLDGGVLLAGFVDLQVNGGGGVLFNDAPTVEALATMAEAHRQFGTTGLMPTLISEDLTVVETAIAATREAIASGIPGIIGIHIEGPFLNPGKAGIHDRAKFRKLDSKAVDLLMSLENGKTLVTLAPELCDADDIARLVKAGVVVCAGHSLASFEQAERAFQAGVGGTTHLFNAMSQLASREPGLVGAALLQQQAVHGLIVDGRHVHPAAMRVAWRMLGSAAIALVTDAMSTVGGPDPEFEFNGETIRIDGYSCVAPDGTLAGSNLNMAAALRNAMAMVGVSLAEAAMMASQTPARLLGLDHRIGLIAPGLRADLVHLDDELEPTLTCLGGVIRPIAR